MRNFVGIVRSNDRLKRAKKRLDLLYRETEELYQRSSVTSHLCELRNMITVAYLIVTHSQKREENKGGFYNLDLI